MFDGLVLTVKYWNKDQGSVGVELSTELSTVLFISIVIFVSFYVSRESQECPAVIEQGIRNSNSILLSKYQTDCFRIHITYAHKLILCLSYTKNKDRNILIIKHLTTTLLSNYKVQLKYFVYIFICISFNPSANTFILPLEWHALCSNGRK